MFRSTLFLSALVALASAFPPKPPSTFPPSLPTSYPSFPLVPSSQHCPQAPLYFVLAGDSTTATQRATNTSNGGGWGDGFLNHTLKCRSSGVKYGHNGATTASFRAGGDWANVLSTVAEKKGSYNVFVTIQSTSGVSLTQYAENLKTFAREVQAAGATPILVTPLTRRSYTNTTGYPLITEDLNQNRFTTIAAARATGSRFIDLNAASTAYCDEVGQAACWVYNLYDGSGDVQLLNGPTDRTHLNFWGSVVFGRMVSDLMGAKYPDIRAVTAPNVTMSNAIWNGVAV